jgi:hypothetical protein
MFSGVVYSEYSRLENPYIVQETTDAVAKPREAAKNVVRQELKKRIEEGKLKRATVEAESLTRRLQSENGRPKSDRYKSQLNQQINHMSGRAAAAKKRVDHYAAKIEKQTAPS